jgi:peptidylprolyl isomerase
MAIKDPENTLIMDTTQGKVVIALRPDLAPKHVERIKQLAREGFYDGIVFHRVIEGFMAQTGCPKGTGTGGRNIPTCRPSSTPRSTCAVCARWRSQAPNSANSQFFIRFDDATFLDKQYTAWGKVIEGMENVDKIKREPVANPDKIKSLKVPHVK